jgi:hypothetical protein
MRMRALAALLAGAGAAGPAAAEVPPVESAVIGEARVSVHGFAFLTEEEAAALKLVLVNEAALALFVPEGQGGHAAMAVSPDDGFIRDGGLVPSAVAIAGMASAEEAAAAALAGCEAARKGAAACVVVLEVAPQ